MKKNDAFMLLAALIYSLLFFEQNPGINFLLFDVSILLLFIARDPAVFRNKKWLWAATLLLTSGTAILLHGNELGVISNTGSLLLVAAYAGSGRSSAFFAGLYAFCSILLSPARLLQKFFRNRLGQARGGLLVKSLAVVVALVITVLFLLLYEDANPLFAHNMSWISLEFINIDWFVFALVALVICHGLFDYKPLEKIEHWEVHQPINNPVYLEKSNLALVTERLTGLIVFICLNIMLLVLNAGDISSIWLGKALPAGISHSDFVHRGVFNIIFSILVAGILIMYLFRKNYTSIEKSKILKILVSAWIAQTLFMLGSTLIRNSWYIQEYSLTHKRIGVYIWIALATFGLILMLYKILSEKSNWFLLTRGFAGGISMFCVMALFSWDRMITRYNLSHQPVQNVDFRYLFRLSESNIPELLAFTAHPDFPGICNKLREGARPLFYEKEMAYKVRNFVSSYSAQWPSWNLKESRIIRSLSQR